MFESVSLSQTEYRSRMCDNLHDLIAIQRVDFCISRAHKYICGVIELCKKARC